MSLQKTKLTLLAHSTNMLNAASAQDWTQFQTLEMQWNDMLETAFSEHGDALQSIVPQLLEDNQTIQNFIKKAQSQLSAEVQQSAQSVQSVKQYLK